MLGGCVECDSSGDGCWLPEGLEDFETRIGFNRKEERSMGRGLLCCGRPFRANILGGNGDLLTADHTDSDTSATLNKEKA